MRHDAILPKLKDLRQETITPESPQTRHRWRAIAGHNQPAKLATAPVETTLVCRGPIQGSGQGQHPETKAVAVAITNGPGERLLGTVDNGGDYATADEVADWPELSINTSANNGFFREVCGSWWCGVEL